MFPLRTTLFFLLSTLFPAAHAQSGGADVRLAPVIPPQIIIAPTEVRSDPTLARGCWVRLFPEAGYKGDNDLTIAGPVELPSLHRPAGGIDWHPKAESLIVGPKATLTVYENQSFRGPSETIKSGTQHPQLRKDIGMMQSIDSLKIACAK